MKNICFIFCVLIPCIIFSNTIHVPSQYSTIQNAINQSVSGDTVLVDTGTYNEAINFNGKNIVVTSHFIFDKDTSQISQTIIDGNHTWSTVTFNSNEDSTTKLIGFTIQNGFLANGGGIYCENSDPILIQLIIRNNFSSFSGGGIYAENSNLKLVDVLIKDNTTGWDDWVAAGGGIYITHSNSMLKNVRIISNEARGGLGGSAGGGIACIYSVLLLKNVLICKNYEGALSWGGSGMASYDSKLTLINTTISENRGIGLGSEKSDLIVINSISWNNPSNEFQISVDDTNKIIISHCDIEDSINGIAINNPSKMFWLENNINIDPEFVNPNENNYNLLPSSPCIDAGIQDTFLVYNNNNDTLYIPEINYFGLAPDMGAFEFDPATNLNNKIINTPVSIYLYQNYPNPFNAETTIKYFLPKPGGVKIEIYNLLGQKITTLINQPQKNGMHQVVWNGRDENGNSVSSGVYIYNLTSGNYLESKKLLLLK
jgi:predicted outer membrane repeat protein